MRQEFGANGIEMQPPTNGPGFELTQGNAVDLSASHSTSAAINFSIDEVQGGIVTPIFFSGVYSEAGINSSPIIEPVFVHEEFVPNVAALYGHSAFDYMPDYAKATVIQGDEKQQVTVSETERILLELLLASSNKLISKDDIAVNVWPEAPPKEFESYIKVYSQRLRDKLGLRGDKAFLRTIEGHGLMLLNPAQPGYQEMQDFIDGKSDALEQSARSGLLESTVIHPAFKYNTELKAVLLENGNDQLVHLGKREARLLEALLGNKDSFIAKQDVIHMIYGQGVKGKNSVDLSQALHHLRRKLGFFGANDYIQSVSDRIRLVGSIDSESTMSQNDSAA